jgi:ATP-dependent Lon protease
VFPYVVMPLLVGRAASLAALEAGNEEDRLVLLVAQRDAETQEPAAAISIASASSHASGSCRASARARCACSSKAWRARAVTRYVPGNDCLRAVVEPMPAPVLARATRCCSAHALAVRGVRRAAPAAAPPSS